jgi:putative membrane protein insertion efficiency factor/ribonuclease P protein component
MRWYGRLRRKSEIAFVRRRGRRVALPSLAAYAVAARDRRTRVAVTVGKGVGGAVVRNLVRRRIVGALEALGGDAERPSVILIVAQPPAASLPYARLAADVAAALARLRGPADVRRAACALIDVYQRALSPLLGANCRFYPSCSQYAKEAVLKHGLLRGGVFAVRRVVRCHPWNPGGVDNVP